jgi:hypothetical protein
VDGVTIPRALASFPRQGDRAPQTLAVAGPVFPLPTSVAPQPEGPLEVHKAPKDGDGAATSLGVGGSWCTRPSRPSVGARWRRWSPWRRWLEVKYLAPSCSDLLAARLWRTCVCGFGARGISGVADVGLRQRRWLQTSRDGAGGSSSG